MFDEQSVVSSIVILFDEQSYYLMNNHNGSSTIILFDEQSYCFIVTFQVYKSILLQIKETKQIHIFFSWSYLLILLEV